MTTPTLAQTTDRESLLAQIEALPAKRSNAALVLRICDDPSAGVAELGGAVLSDAFLTAKLLKLANSAYFGLSREIRDPAGAISVLGFATVRALALAQLGGALKADDAVPEHFWTHSARVGAACSLLAPHSGGDGGPAVSGGEAFAIGLLHDIGRAVLVDLGATVDFGVDDHACCGDDLDAERAANGTDHCEVGRHLCEVMQLPVTFGEAIGAHHDDDVGASAPPHLRLIRTAVLLSSLAMDGTADEADAALVDQIEALGFGRELVANMAPALDSQAAHLLAVLR